jgi:hypothetical protein
LTLSPPAERRTQLSTWMVIELRPTRLTSQWQLSTSPTRTGRWKVIAATATVATRPRARSEAAMPPAMSICASSQPPKMSPDGLASPGMASVRRKGSPRGTGGSLLCWSKSLAPAPVPRRPGWPRARGS